MENAIVLPVLGDQFLVMLGLITFYIILWLVRSN